MRRWIVLVLAAVSCTKTPLFPGRPRYTTEVGGGRQRPHIEKNATDNLPDGLHLYTTAVRFAEGYDWQMDTVPAGGQERILLLKDGAEVLSVAARGSSSPERHRARAGHLWTDRCEGGWTILSRDGEEVFRWTPEECLKGFILVGGDVFTLGQKLGGKGISLRRNGEALFQDESGTLLGEINDSGWEGGALALDGEDLCYCYSIEVRVGAETYKEYHFMKGDKAVNTLPASSVKLLYDWRSAGGVLYRSELRKDGFYFVAGDKSVKLSQDAPHIAKLKPWKGATAITGYYDYPYRFTAEAADRIILSSFSAYISELFLDGDNLAFVCTDADGRVRSLYSSLYPAEEHFALGNYHLMSPSCGTLRGGCFAVALTNLDSPEHLLCVDDTVVSLAFNGYLTSVRIE